MKGNRFELEIESKLEKLSVISEFGTESTKQLGIDVPTISKVQLAVDEACTNAIKHAYSGRRGIITVILELRDDDLIITIRDYGKPFDPGAAPQPDLETHLDERRTGGLGIYFMRKLVDEVSYSFDAEDGNKLTMRKHLMPRSSDLEGV